MTDISSSAIAATAKRHLGLPLSTADNHVPRFYTDELRRHLALYPHEDNFTVTLQPKFGLGSVKCLKDGCNKVIPLSNRGSGHNGGKTDGFGSLSAYRSHLSDHKTLRVKREPGTSQGLAQQQSANRSKTTTGKEPTASSILNPPSNDSGSSRRDHITGRENSMIQVKSEAAEPTIPRKRLSDVAFKAEPHEADPLGALDPHKAAKKARSDASPKTPLLSVTNSPSVTARSTLGDDLLLATPGLPEDPQEQLDNIRIATIGQQLLLDRVRAKPLKTAQDIIDMNTYQAELHRLWALEQQCAVSAASPSTSAPFLHRHPYIKSEAAHQPLPSPAWTNGLDVDVKPHVAQSFPMDVDVKPSSSSSRSLFTAAAAHSIFGSPNPFLRGSTPIATPAAPQRLSLPQFDNAVASSSKPPQKDNGAPGAAKAKALRTPLNAQASGSNTPQMPGGFPSILSDGDDDSEEDDSYEYGLPDTSALVDRMGIKLPPPILDDAHDGNGDYHGRGRDLYVGPQAARDDLEKFLVHAGNAESFDGNESVDKALNHLGLRNLNDKIPGMEVSLMAHQAIGVAWMLDKEKSVMKGGCLADEMGLGKTIQMIACMLKNKPIDGSPKTTLIVAPLALLDQWKAEIELRTNCDLKCLIYHGSSKTKSKAVLMKHDIVLTTFNTVAREWPDFEAEMKKKSKAKKRGDDFIVSDDEEDMKDTTYRSNKRKQKAGLLFQVDWHRVILDEAQNIRNRRTRVSRAITDVKAVYRWCLTGTPIVNTLSDAYGYIRFLKVRPWYDCAEFQNHIGLYERKRPDLAVTRLQAVLSSFLLRRKKDSKLDGKPLIELPEKEVKLVRLEFSDEERDIYKMIEARQQAKFNRYLRAGTVLKNYHQVLVLLLRLRQVCSHPSLVQEDGVAFISPDEVVEFKAELATELTRARRLVSEEFASKMKEKLKEEALARSSANATMEEDECPICYDAMTDAVVTHCTHVFCRECIVDFLNTAQPADDGDRRDGSRDCPCCREPIDVQRLFSRSAFEPSDKDLNPKSGDDSDIAMDEDEDEPVYVGKGKGKANAPKQRKKPSRRRADSDDEGDDVNYSGPEDDDDDDDDISDFIVESDEDEEEKDARRALKKRLGKKRATIILDSDDEPDTPEEKEVLFGVPDKKKVVSLEAIKLMPRFLPSSKMKYMMDQLQKLVKSNPEEKTLIVSQWTGCLSLVSDYLTEKGIPHVKYQGDMNRTKRDVAVQIFMAKEKARVMLMSLKCGGVGLNLTRANNVISLDLGWSQAVESQAFDRVHRLGQTRKVLVQRVVIEDTVEERILKMQERKQTLADGTLGEGSAKKIGKLSVKELANLFGLDARGRVLRND